VTENELVETVNKTKVIFLCTGNSARSQMAEALLRELAGDRYDVYSGGLRPVEVNELAVRVMRERGIDISGQRSKGLDEFLGKVNFGVIITLCDQAERECPIFPGISTRLHWPFEDPAAADGEEEERLAKFRETRDAIERRIREWLEDDQPQP
jgi:arsenate reductase (thioredoxin)